MMYAGINYLDDNNFVQYNGRISCGDEERLLHIARTNNQFTFDMNNIIMRVIREYYKEHHIAERIKETTGIECKEYDELRKMMSEKRVYNEK